MRPFRNPETRGQWQANYDWKAAQCRLPIMERDAEYIFQPAWCLDHDMYMPGYHEDFIQDDFGGAVYPPLGHRPRAFGGVRMDGGLRIAAERPAMAANDGALKRYPALNLAKLAEGPNIERDVKLPPFKVDYDSHEQIHQKLNGTVILIKNNPFYVRETAETPNGFALVVSNAEGETKHVFYKDVADCRGIAPGYFTYRGAAYWVYRGPERQNQQGMNGKNTFYKTAGSTAVNGARHDFLLSALLSAKDVKYQDNLVELMTGGAVTSLRLTNRLALYMTNKKGAPVGVEYCGRPLGLIVNSQCKVHEECDLTPSWIHKDAHQAGLALTA